MKRLLAFAALPLALAAALLGVSGTERAAVAAPQPGPSCLLGILCLPSASSSPTTSPSPTSAGPSASTSPSPTGAGPTGASASPTVSPSASPSPSAGPTPSASRTPSAHGRRKPQAKIATATPGLVLSGATTVLAAGSATFTNFTYAGNVDMPAAGAGTVTMMKFTADTITLSAGVTYSVAQNGATAVETSNTLDFTGGVTFYATQMSGSLLGVPLTFTPSTADTVFLSLLLNPVTAAVIPSITLTSTSTDQSLATAGSVRYTPLSVGFGAS